MTATRGSHRHPLLRLLANASFLSFIAHPSRQNLTLFSDEEVVMCQSVKWSILASGKRRSASGGLVRHRPATLTRQGGIMKRFGS